MSQTLLRHLRVRIPSYLDCIFITGYSVVRSITPVWGTGNRRFKSGYPDQFIEILSVRRCTTVLRRKGDSATPLRDWKRGRAWLNAPDSKPGTPVTTGVVSSNLTASAKIASLIHRLAMYRFSVTPGMSIR